jgi:hypothetical protein
MRWGPVMLPTLSVAMLRYPHPQGIGEASMGPVIFHYRKLLRERCLPTPILHRTDGNKVILSVRHHV